MNSDFSKISMHEPQNTEYDDLIADMLSRARNKGIELSFYQMCQAMKIIDGVPKALIKTLLYSYGIRRDQSILKRIRKELVIERISLAIMVISLLLFPVLVLTGKGDLLFAFGFFNVLGAIFLVLYYGRPLKF